MQEETMKEKERELFKRTSLEQVLLMNNLESEPWFHYLTSLPLNQFQRNALVLRRKKKPLVITTVLWHGMLKEHPELETKLVENRAGFIKALRNALPGKKVGFNRHEYTATGLSRLKRTLKGKKLVDVSRELAKLRETKTKREQKLIARAVRITENALESVPEFFRRGMSERELAVRLECTVLESGADTTSFPVIVASGKNAAVPHHITSKKKIKNGFLLVDFGARYKNYCADLSRTFFVGRASEKERKLYETVFRAKEKAEETAMLGKKASALFNAADLELKKAGYGMIHALGHGIGLQDHDFPTGISKKSKWGLREGMCLAIEPAVYGKFGGIRIEDNYVVKKKLAKMSSAPGKLVLLS